MAKIDQFQTASQEIISDFAKIVRLFFKIGAVFGVLRGSAGRGKADFDENQAKSKTQGREKSQRKKKQGKMRAQKEKIGKRKKA